MLIASGGLIISERENVYKSILVSMMIFIISCVDPKGFMKVAYDKNIYCNT